MSLDLHKIRKKISKIDRTLLKLLAQRHQLAYDVARSKEITQKPLRDTDREQQLLQQLIEVAQQEGYLLHEEYISEIFKRIIEDSVLTQQAYLQNKLNVQQNTTLHMAFLGSDRSCSHLAAIKYTQHYQKSLQALFCASFKEVFNAVTTHQADFAIVPIEDTRLGVINEVYDLLQQTNLFVVGELTYPIKQGMLAKSIQPLNQIHTPYSHSQTIQQCYQFNNVHVKNGESLSHALQFVPESYASLGNKETGTLYGSCVIETDRVYQQHNITKFWVLSATPLKVSSQVQSKTLLLIRPSQSFGSLEDALCLFKKYHINSINLASRPIDEQTERKMFYLELNAHLQDNCMQQALSELKHHGGIFKVLGCYPSEIVNPVSIKTTNVC